MMRLTAPFSEKGASSPDNDLSQKPKGKYTYDDN